MTRSDRHRRILVRLFRLWAMAREDGEMTLRRMHEAAIEFGLPGHTAPASSSLFTLVEGTLGRPLVREACCAPRFSADETALIGVVEAAPALETMRGSVSVPHGLPGALRWAAVCIGDALGWPLRYPAVRTTSVSEGKCPFSGVEARLAP